jgi:nitroreductase
VPPVPPPPKVPGGLIEGMLARRTTNGPFRPGPVKVEHQHLLMRVAQAAPSHFNSQPWRFVLIEDRGTIREVARISGESMTELIEAGVFFERYRRYFRFSEAELEQRRDGIHIDHLPGPLRPFTRQVFSDAGLRVMRQLGVPKKLGEDNRRLVEGSPLLLAALLDTGPANSAAFTASSASARRWKTSGTRSARSVWACNSSPRRWRFRASGGRSASCCACRTTSS